MTIITAEGLVNPQYSSPFNKNGSIVTLKKISETDWLLFGDVAEGGSEGFGEPQPYGVGWILTHMSFSGSRQMPSSNSSFSAEVFTINPPNEFTITSGNHYWELACLTSNDESIPMAGATLRLVIHTESEDDFYNLKIYIPSTGEAFYTEALGSYLNGEGEIEIISSLQEWSYLEAFNISVKEGGPQQQSITAIDVFVNFSNEEEH